MGVIEPQDGGQRAIVVAACAQGLDEHGEAGRAFEQIGRAITQTMLQPLQPRAGGGASPAAPSARRATKAAAAAQTRAGAMKRRSEFDVARGLMLVLMTVTHVPTRFSQPTGQPFDMSRRRKAS